MPSSSNSFHRHHICCIQDHRLEFNTKFRISPSCDTLYQYWNDKITQHLNAQFRELVSEGKGKGTGVKILLDCASAEYMKSIQRTHLDKDIHIVEIVLQHKGITQDPLSHSLPLSRSPSLTFPLSLTFTPSQSLNQSINLLLAYALTRSTNLSQEKSMQLMPKERGVCLLDG